MDQNNAANGEGVAPEIEQVVETQSDTSSNAELSSMETLLEEEGLGLELPKQGEVRTGVIATIGDSEILVSVGSKSEGVISGREVEQLSEEERAAFKVGVEIPVYVVTPEDAAGNVVLSYVRAREMQDWEEAQALLESTEPFESKIIGYNKGGLLVPLGRLRGFVPASQVSLLRRSMASGDSPDQRWGKMVGEEITVRVIEVDQERRRLILSERAALQETRETLKERLLEELDEGDVRQGRVTSVADFGAFVNIDGADGLVHLSEISWERIQHPSEVLEIGQEVEVKVISIDHDRKRIGLSIRQLQEDPWVKRVKHLREGQLVEGTVTHLTKFGAFARLDEDLEGLIHVSELSEQRVNHPKEVVKEGDVLTLRVIKIDTDRRRIGLSLRKVDSPAYQDLDWKIALAEEVEEVQDFQEEEEEVLEEAPVAAVTEEVVSADASAEEVQDIAVTEAVEETRAAEAVSQVSEAEGVEELAEAPEVAQDAAQEVAPETVSEAAQDAAQDAALDETADEAS